MKFRRYNLVREILGGKSVLILYEYQTSHFDLLNSDNQYDCFCPQYEDARFVGSCSEPFKVQTIDLIPSRFWSRTRTTGFYASNSE